MLELNPRRSPHWVGDKLLSFGTLQRTHIWPREIADAFRAFQDGQPVSPGHVRVFTDGSLFGEPQPEQRVFALQETRPGGWTNSEWGRGFLDRHSATMTVLDALSFDDIARLPKSGAFLYRGDGLGGFYAEQTATADGKGPCARCLLMRYLAGRRASSRLYAALRQGARVAFPLSASEQPEFSTGKGLELFGQCHSEAIAQTTVAPLPDCLDCLRQWPKQVLRAGLFAPVTKVVSVEANHVAHLPEMLWLAGEETVGGGGCHDPDPVRGQTRAVHEALERYAAHFLPPSVQPEGIVFQGQQGQALFSRKRALLTEPGSVSTGLACSDSLQQAIGHALAEVCERDALARFWLGLDSHSVQLVRHDSVCHQGLTVERYQLDSYHLPTALCLTRTPEGQVASGSAAAPLPEAFQKALAECLQNVAYLKSHAVASPKDPPETFEEHSSLYWHGFRVLPDLEPYLTEVVEPRPLPASVYHCDLTPPDLARLGLFAVRVQVPGLLYLPMSHHDWADVLKEAAWPEGRVPIAPHPFS